MCVGVFGCLSLEVLQTVDIVLILNNAGAFPWPRDSSAITLEKEESNIVETLYRFYLSLGGMRGLAGYRERETKRVRGVNYILEL